MALTTNAPLEVSLLSGLVTALPQSPLSHVNTRFAEKGIPSVAIPEIYSQQTILSLHDKLVRVAVDEEGLVIELAGLEAAEAHWLAHQPSIALEPVDLEVEELHSFEDIALASKAAFHFLLRILSALFGMSPQTLRPSGARRHTTEPRTLDPEASSGDALRKGES